MTQQLTLYHYWRSSCSWRVRWALQVKNASYQDVPVNLLNGEHQQESYLKLNPNGFVPALAIDGVPFGESLAILEWIEENWPTPALLPENRLERLRVRQICNMIVSGIQPVQNLSVLRRLSPDSSVQAAWANSWIKAGLTKLETLIGPTTGSYSFGGELTLADICLIPQVYNALRFNVSMDDYPKIARIYEHCLTLPSCEKAAPHNQKGAQKL